MGTEEETAAAVVEAVKRLAILRRRFSWFSPAGAGRWIAAAPIRC